MSAWTSETLKKLFRQFDPYTGTGIELTGNEVCDLCDALEQLDKQLEKIHDKVNIDLGTWIETGSYHMVAGTRQELLDIEL